MLLSADGERLAVGDSYNDDGGNSAGHVRIFDKPSYLRYHPEDKLEMTLMGLPRLIMVVIILETLSHCQLMVVELSLE